MYTDASLRHLLANIGGVLVRGWLCMWPSTAGFWRATVGRLLGAGASSWLLGAPHSVHIGASGLIFGYAGYLVARGLYTRRILSVLVAMFVVWCHGMSLLYGVLPLTPGVSWQGHLGGAIGGLLMARASRHSRS
ncbi:MULTISPECIES: rhomboid family intramembrane serine protease [Burkholderia]|uniref:rhomboid family intramembrane serine protease n=1 Tax=Burkholderia TaxID=32008 RepID=UPI0007560465|nr:MULTISPECIES: rhomboid family intramembrane serine protease [Burkholderia]AOJ72866.1 hypothetical protein WS78_29830 [Burkholderia savannae]KVG44903.1 hypothetical protein WS77_06915 [Burkholderia sp. MSMB0265]KVG89890.1 hypothetical protein WS81_19150 [Burkholderia sp. MSMB2040]KVG96028.1 hypothetical protein WS82_02325 [Burkholderia sp. MSMB2041]KVG99655.1 hypothetical protein WS83_24360 [Burkholderia sp. MSMB2042]